MDPTGHSGPGMALQSCPKRRFLYALGVLGKQLSLASFLGLSMRHQQEILQQLGDKCLEWGHRRASTAEQ